MTPEEHRKLMERRIKEAEEGKAFQREVASTHAEMTQRIFVEGVAADESIIGTYSTKPISISQKSAPTKLPGIGKSFRFVGGYQAFRIQQGRSPVVNLNLWGQLQSDWANGLKKVSDTEMVSAVKNPLNALKIEGQEAHWHKKIFSPTKTEREDLVKRLQDAALNTR